MSEVENQKKTCESDHVSTQIGITALVGFILSVIIILISLIILVRFWAFENFIYNLFVFSYLIVGIIFNIAAVNLTLNEYPYSVHLLPFVIGSPVIMFWAVFCCFYPISKGDLFSQFAQLPIATYDSGFYDGLGYNPNSTTVHPFAKPFMSENSLFDNTPVLIFLLIILGVVQLIFWVNTVVFYYKIKKEEINIEKMNIEDTKDR